MKIYHLRPALSLLGAVTRDPDQVLFRALPIRRCMHDSGVHHSGRHASGDNLYYCGKAVDGEQVDPES